MKKAGPLLLLLPSLLSTHAQFGLSQQAGDSINKLTRGARALDYFETDRSIEIIIKKYAFRILNMPLHS